MKSVRYSRGGISISDFQAEEYALGAKDRDLHVSTENVITWLRVHVKYGLIDYNEIEILFKDQILKIDKNGELNHYPIGFCDYHLNALTKLI